MKTVPPNATSTSNSPSSTTWVVVGRLLSVVVVAAAALGMVVAALWVQNRRYELDLLEEQGSHRINREFEFLSREIRSVQSDLLYLAQQDVLRRFLAGNDSLRHTLEQDYVRLVVRKSMYDQIRCLDMLGKEVLRVNYHDGEPEIVPINRLQSKADRYYYKDASRLGEGEVFVSNFDLNVEHGSIQRPLKPVIRMLTPVFDESGAKRGLLALNVSGNHLFHNFNEISLPGSTMLLNLDGHYLYTANPQDAWGWLLGHDRTFAKHYPEVWRRMAGNADGQFRTNEGLFTFRSLSLSQGRLPGQNMVARNNVADIKRSGTHVELNLILVSHVPADMQFAASAKLLNQLLLVYLGAMLLVVILAWYWAHASAIRTAQAQRIAESELRLRVLSNQLLTAQESERRSISRQLHDVLGQQVTAIRLDLQTAARHKDRRHQQSLLGKTINATEHLLDNLHEIASRVRPSVLDDLGLPDAVESFSSEFQQRTGIEMQSRLDVNGRPIPPSVGENVYRILQEALTNVAKHAQTKAARIQLKIDDENVSLIVQDNGVGFATEQLDTSRLGILGMQERAELLDGQFLLTTAPGKGTRIEVRIPLREQRQPS